MGRKGLGVAIRREGSAVKRNCAVLALVAALCVLGLLAVGCGNAAKAREAIARGDAAMEKGEFEAAVRAYEEALQLDPDNATARAKLEGAKKSRDFADYVKSVTPILDEVGKLATAWDELRQESAAGRISDLELGKRVLNDLMPKNRELAERAEALFINVPKELRDAHEELIGMLNLNLQALSEVAAAIDARDLSRITSANKLFSDARAAERRYVQKLEDLAAECGVKFTK